MQRIGNPRLLFKLCSFLVLKNFGKTKSSIFNFHSCNSLKFIKYFWCETSNVAVADGSNVAGETTLIFCNISTYFSLDSTIFCLSVSLSFSLPLSLLLSFSLSLSFCLLLSLTLSLSLYLIPLSITFSHRDELVYSVPMALIVCNIFTIFLIW